MTLSDKGSLANTHKENRVNPNYIEVTKDDIIDALEDEPLSAGDWLDESGCRACAVGSVLRNKLPALAERQIEYPGQPFTTLMHRITDNCYSNTSVAPGGNYLAALSIVWEYLNSRNDSGGRDGIREEEARDLILDWAEENIPEDYVARVEVPTYG